MGLRSDPIVLQSLGSVVLRGDIRGAIPETSGLNQPLPRYR